MTLLIAVMFGAAAALAVWGLRHWIARRFEADVAWISTSLLRFTPRPPDARMVAAAVYILYAALLLVLLAAVPAVPVAVGIWLVLLAVPRVLVEVAWAKRRARIDQQLATAITMMANSIRAGLTLVQALQRLAEQTPEPIRTEFRIMAGHYALGADVETTVREAKRRLNLPNFNLFASALLLNREMGGDVAETLDRVSRSLERLHQMRQTVEAHTAEGRTNIKVLLVAPLVMLAMIAAVDAPGVEMMFTTPQGYGVLLAAALLAGAGVYFASRISRSEV